MGLRGSKVAAIALVLISTLLVSVLAAVISQAAHGYFGFEFDKYLLWYLAPMSVSLVLTAVLAVFLQVLSPHKFVGWGLMVLYIVAGMTFSNLGFEHRLYNYGGGGLVGPMVPTSDINRLGKFWIGAWWVRPTGAPSPPDWWCWPTPSGDAGPRPACGPACDVCPSA